MSSEGWNSKAFHPKRVRLKNDQLKNFYYRIFWTTTSVRQKARYEKGEKQTKAGQTFCLKREAMMII